MCWVPDISCIEIKIVKNLNLDYQEFCLFHSMHAHTHESVDTPILTGFWSRSDSTRVPVALL